MGGNAERYLSHNPGSSKTPQVVSDPCLGHAGPHPITVDAIFSPDTDFLEQVHEWLQDWQRDYVVCETAFGDVLLFGKLTWNGIGLTFVHRGWQLYIDTNVLLYSRRRRSSSCECVSLPPGPASETSTTVTHPRSRADTVPLGCLAAVTAGQGVHFSPLPHASMTLSRHPVGQQGNGHACVSYTK
jgi:hypothetical protein